MSAPPPAGARSPAPPTSARSTRKAEARTGRARARPLLALPVLALALGALSLLAPEPALAQETTAVSNHAQTKYDEYGTGKDVRAQGFTTGTVAGGYALTSIATKFGPDTYNYTASRMRAQLWSAAAGGGPGSKLADLEIPPRVWPGVPVSFTAPGTELEASTKYYFVVYTTKTENQNYMNFPVHATQGKGEDSGGLAGWSLEDFSYRQHTDNAPTGAWRKNTTAALQLRVNAAAAPSEPRNVKIVSGDDEVTLTWQVPTSWGNWNAAGYSFEVFGQGGTWEAAGLLTNPTATTHTLVRGIYGDTLEVCNGCNLQVNVYAYSQRPGTDGSKGSHFVLSADAYTARVTVGGPMAAPTGLTVTPSARALGLSWTAPAAGTAEPLTGYDVHYTSATQSNVEDDAPASGRNAATAWVDANHTGTTASATIGRLAASTAHRVRVRAKNTHGGGPWVLGSGTTPAAWTPLTIKERNRKLEVSWTAPSQTITGYDVDITSAAPGVVADNAAASGSDLTKAWFSLNRGTEASPPRASGDIAPLTNNTTYRIRVRWHTATSNSVWSFGSGTPKIPAVKWAAKRQSVTEGGTAAVGLSISYALGTQSTINLAAVPSISTADSDDYTSVPTSVTLPASGTSTSFNVATTDDSVNEDHETLVLELNGIANAPYSWPFLSHHVTILDNDRPTEPTVLALSGGLQSLTATWEQPAGPVQLYEVQIKEASAPDQDTTDTTPAGGWDLVATVSKTASEDAPNSVTIRGDLGDADNEYFLRHRTAYHVRVRANDGQTGTGNGYSDWSAPRTVTTAHVSSPSAPRFFRAEPNDPGELRVSWWRPNRGRDGAGLGTSSRTTHFDLHYTSAAETEVPDNAAASGTDPSVAWINANLRASIISSLQGVLHRLRVRYHNRFGAGAWAYTTGTPQAVFQTTAPTIKVPKPWVLPLNLRWEHPVPGLTPNGYHVHYTSAPATGEGAVADDALPVSGTDPAAGWVDAKSNANRVATTANGHNSWYAPALKRGTEYRFRVRASYEHYVFHRRRPDRHGDWSYKTLVAGAGTAVGLFAFNAFESRGIASVRFNLANPVSHEVTVDYATSVPPTRAATPGLDYLAVWGTITFAPGDTERWLHLAVTDDDIEDSGEQFVISLSNPRPANRVQLGSSSPGYGYHVHPLAASMTVTIYNHEAELSALTVETAPAEDGPWTALDFGAFSAGTTSYAATVPHGTTHARLKPTALHDEQRLKAGTGSSLQALDSGAASSPIALAVGDNALVVESLVSGEQRTYTVTVTRKAEAPDGVAVSLSATPNPVAEGSPITVTATLAEALEEAVTVPLTTTRGTSDDGDHGSLTSIELPAGSTSATGTITTSTDTDEDDETFTVALGTLPTGLTPGTASSVEVTITDNRAQQQQQQQSTAPLTASFENVPSVHDGKSAVALRVRLSEAPGNGGRAPSAASFRVAYGSVTGVEGVSASLYRVQVKPKSWRDMKVTLAGGRACTEAGAVCTADGRALTNTSSVTIGGPVRIRVEGARAKEGKDESLDFAVTLNRAASHAVSVDYATEDGTAAAGADYTATSGTLTFAAGETAKTVSVPVLDDAVDEGKEVMRLLLSNPQGAFLRGVHTKARGIITNDDPLQRMWLARFGRAAAGHVAEAIDGRLSGPAAAGVVLGGHSLTGGKAEREAIESRLAETLLKEREARFGRGGEAQASPVREVAMSDLLLASSFHMASAEKVDAGSRWSLWGRGARSSFEGAGGDLSLEGDVTTATVGFDYERARWLVGVALSRSAGDGSYKAGGACDAGCAGEVESTLTGVYPYARYRVSGTFSLWGAVGHGQGEMTLTPGGSSPVEADMAMGMAAAGARGVVLPAREAGGFELALRADVLVTNTRSDAAAGLAETDAETSRVRLVLEGSRSLRFGDAVLTPSLEIGFRNDSGDAETGGGVEAGGSVRWTSGALTTEVRARGLLSHGAGGYEEWGVSASVAYAPGSGGRGLTLRAGSSWGASTGGAERLWSQAAGLAPAGAFEPGAAGFEAEAAWGLDAPRGLLTPYTGVAVTGNAETWRAGARWKPGAATEVSLEASLTEQAGGGRPEGGLLLRGSKRW